MAIHAGTFRIEYDGTYDDRYNSVVAAIRAQTTTAYWDEPTSFFLIESGKNSASIADAVVLNSEFDARKDLLLVINLTEKGYTPRGVVKDGDLNALMARR